jgi:hypothetical protein
VLCGAIAWAKAAIEMTKAAIELIKVAARFFWFELGN